MAVEIYITRHGETQENIAGILQGWLDGTLSEQGRQQSEDLGKRLKKMGLVFDAIYSSDLGRARETAEIIKAQMGYERPVEYCFELRERDNGMLNTKTIKEVNGDISLLEMKAMLHCDEYEQMHPCVEKRGSVMARAEKFARENIFSWFTGKNGQGDGSLRQHGPGKTRQSNNAKILVVGHGFSNSYLIKELLGEHDNIQFHRQENCGLYHIYLKSQGHALMQYSYGAPLVTVSLGDKSKYA